MRGATIAPSWLSYKSWDSKMSNIMTYINLEGLLLTFTPTNYVKNCNVIFFEFLAFAYVEIPQLSVCPEG